MMLIVAYKPTWHDEFLGIGHAMRHALGGLAVRIDHIGSTAVPGLAAKDVIDIQITVQNLAPAIEEALRVAGYKRLEHITQDHVPLGSDAAAEWTKWFFKPALPDLAVNTHVRIAGRANQRYALLFRDYLRANPAIAEAYARVKLGLVAHRLDDQEAYYDIKDPVCDIIIGGAEGWAVASDWKMSLSDC